MPKVLEEVEVPETGKVDITDIPEIDDKELENMMKAEPAEPPETKEPEKTKQPLYKRPRMIAIAAVFLIAAIFFGFRYYVYANAHESTDDAFIDGHIIQISPQVTGHIVKVYITDNQEVKKGDLLAEIDPRDYEAKLAQSRATLQAALSKQKSAQINVGLISTSSSAGVQ